MLFLLLLVVVLFYWIRLFRDTKGICFWAPNVKTDGEKMLITTCEYNEKGFFTWPGRIHFLNNGNGRAELREYWIICLSFLQRVFPKKERISEHLNVTLSLTSHCLASILIYFLSNFFLPNHISFFISIIFLTSTWSTEVAIYYGHVLLAQFWFLCSMGFVLLAHANQTSNFNFYIYLFISGFLSSICLNSSSASRKFPPVIIFSQLYVCYFLFADPSLGTIVNSLILIILSFLLIRPFLKRILNLLSNPNIINLKISSPFRNDQNKNLALNFISPILSIAVAVFIPAFLAKYPQKYLEAQFIFALGMFISFFIVLMPKPLINLKRYMTFLDMGNWASHFKSYKNQEKTFGRKLPSDFRGGGLKWIPLFFWSVMPIECVLFGLTLISMTYCLYLGEINFITLSLIVLIGILPTLIVEITRGLQIGKSYLPSQVGLLITIVLGYEYLIKVFPIFTPYLFALLSVFQIYRLIKNYKKDLLPCRMGASYLREFLFKNNIKTFYTYDTNYNTQFVSTAIYGFESNFNVKYANSINECPKDSYFVIPPTSSKSVLMETESEAINQGDFRKDPSLNSLLDNNLIHKYSIAKFKTLGCSKFYVNESEVTSYRYHILKQIFERDRILSYGWVLDLKLLS